MHTCYEGKITLLVTITLIYGKTEYKAFQLQSSKTPKAINLNHQLQQNAIQI